MPVSEPVAFSSATADSVVGDTRLVELLSEEQTGGGFSNALYRFFPQSDGLHYFTFSGGARADEVMAVLFETEDQEFIFPLVRKVTNMDGHKMMSRDLLMPVNASSNIFHLRTETAVFSSETSRALAMDGFDIEAVVGDEPIAFAAYSVSTHAISGTTVPVNEEFVDTCDCYNEETSRFRAPKEGYYYLSFSVGTPGYQVTQVRLMRSRPNRETVALGDYNFDMDGTDTLARSVILHMIMGEEAWIQLWGGSAYSNDVGIHTTFGGWGYFPASHEPQAWSVHTEMGWVSEGDDDWLEPIPFELDGAATESRYEHLPVNTGLWDVDLDTVIADTAGFYLYSVNFGKLGSKRLEVFVQRNNDTVAKLASLSEDLLHNHVASRSMIIHLDVGDTLYLAAAPNSGYFAEEGTVSTSFSGLLLFADNDAEGYYG